MHEKVERPEALVGATYKIKSPLFEHALYVTINDIVLKAMAPDISARYQRAGELLDDVLAARSTSARRVPRTGAAAPSEPA